MIEKWLNFLSGLGAVAAEDRSVRFDLSEQELRTALAGDILCALAGRQGLIAIHGADAETFLQGQFTNDMRQVTPERSQLSAYCNPQGRMLACFRVFRRGDSYYLRLPLEKVEPVIKRLRLFVLRAKVTLEDAGASLIQSGLAGPGTLWLLQETLGAAPAQIDEVVQQADITVIRVPGVSPRFELYGPVGAMMAFWEKLAPRVTLAGAEPWRLLDILAGIPNIYAATTEAFVPQMVNLQLLNGVSFRKGCYTGQEIVARTQHLGKLKRRMYRAHIESPVPPKAGDLLFSHQRGAGQPVGTIVDACRHPDGGYEVLAVVVIEYTENGTVLLGDGQGAKLEFESLPYVVEDVRKEGSE
ncbi:MAG TPA: folate-binding protein YgfZ [Candidatus Competibacteraceae bacterium]|nr:folate-binding protein YgfZ [Candidatus Competibacteraceae bacterium]